MVTVEIDPVVVEQRLGSGGLACPDCAGRLAGWGRARTRVVRGLDGATVVTPRRSRCTRCRATHVLLPVLLLVRRADTAAVIGAALTARAAGRGIGGSPPVWGGRWTRSGADCGASPPALRQCGRCSPGGVGRWIRTRCCPARLGRRGRTRWPRSLRRPGQCMPASRAVGAAGAAQQDRVTARWPDTHPCLFPRHRASAAGTRPLTYYSYRSLLNRWLVDCDIRDEHGQPARLTPHRPLSPCRVVSPMAARSGRGRRGAAREQHPPGPRSGYARPVGSGTLSD